MNEEDRDWALKTVMHLLDENSMLDDILTDEEQERYRNIYAEEDPPKT